jgi:hypothetical protein
MSALTAGMEYSRLEQKAFVLLLGKVMGSFIVVMFIVYLTTLSTAKITQIMIITIILNKLTHAATYS